MRKLHLVSGVAATIFIFAAAILGLSDPASARQLTFKECEALNVATYSGHKVAHGQQGKVDAVVKECMRLHGKKLSTVGDIEARRSLEHQRKSERRYRENKEFAEDVLGLKGGKNHGGRKINKGHGKKFKPGFF